MKHGPVIVLLFLSIVKFSLQFKGYLFHKVFYIVNRNFYHLR